MEMKEKNIIEPKTNRVRFLNNSIKFFLIRISKNKETLEASYKGMRTLMENQITLDVDREQEYRELIDIFDKVYELFRNEELRKVITENEITVEQLVSKFGEKILGDNKRSYNMSEMFNEGLISKKGDSEDSRNIVYKPITGKEHSFQSLEGKQVVIQKIGRLYYEEWNKIRSEVSKYRIRRQISENDYRLDEVFSNIDISEMQEFEYRYAVLEELLNQNNIQLSNAGGYIGRISKVPNNSKGFEVGSEKMNAGTYLYRINEKYMLDYDNTDLSAVMLYEEEMAREKREEKLAQENQKEYINQEKATVEATENISFVDLNKQQEQDGDEIEL